MRSSGRLIVSILVAVALAIAFWTLILSPKREQADQLGQEVQQMTTTVETARSEVVTANAAKQAFPADYRQLVVLGQAAPAGDETASLLVELEGIANSSGVIFKSIQLESSGEEVAAAPVPTPTTPEAASGESPESVQAAATVPPTEVAASLLPLGASIGPAGLYVMPYGLEFSGDFFQITNFIKKVDALVKPGGKGIEVDGRLITISSFSLGSGTEGEASGGGDSELAASLTVTTYLTPPSQGITAGATAASPAPATAEPAASVPTAESPPPTAESSPATSETVSAK